MNSYIQLAADQKVIVKGELTFATVNSIWQTSLPLLKQLPNWHIDLQQVNHSDSAGLALLLEWCRLAKDSNKTVDFQHIPTQLHTIILANHLQKTLSIDNHDTSRDE